MYVNIGSIYRCYIELGFTINISNAIFVDIIHFI